ncbi:MAG: ATP-binding protein [Erysipelotrichaceae bacterium]|nr:ATP-binding protein [Erysipelotrichaceae bacterium]
MIIGREREIKELRDAYDSDVSEFVAVYGRRRVGKTFLIRETFQDQFIFQHAGIYRGKRKEQLEAFGDALSYAGLKDVKTPENWKAAFNLLKDLILSSDSKRKVIFIDELSWMDTPRSDLIMALEHFWNSWASARKDILLIVCSSVTSWMINKIIHNKGGLYNRLTYRIHLEPFTLHECELYVEKSHLEMSRYNIMEAYMIIGGIPYYWGFMKKEYSLSQNIDEMFFKWNAGLSNEFKYLFSSLFKNAEDYITIIETLSSKISGLSRNEILEISGLKGSGDFSNKLEELEQCGFIRSYVPYGNRKKDMKYQLIDPFVIFHYHFLVGKSTDEHFWSNQLDTPRHNVWSGLAFERICLLHINEIKKALGISGVQTEVYTWSCKEDLEKGLSGSQIDLVLERRDRVINLLEMKFSSGPYVITKDTDMDLRRKKNDFKTATKTKSAVHTTMITPYGLMKNAYAGDIQSEVTVEDLFKE